MNQFINAENLEIGGYTDVGRRAQNEDTFLIDRELGLVVVADGVGGGTSPARSPAVSPVKCFSGRLPLARI